ncbi:response regulator [Polyangium aurulentum]|uniref:response regulator n=1 Tax=Polyangium aurulentum TaxID=2567896 RepID=UPI001F21CE7D|nr:response regulator [Polyangium aurulentum]
MLVVEDDVDIRGLIADILRLEGYSVDAVENGREALEHLRAGPPPRVILLDLMMPEMNGWEFRTAQAQDPALAEIPVVILTGGGNAAAAAQGLGVDAFLRKPVDLDELLEMVKRYC